MHPLLVRRRFLQGLQLLLVLACLWAGAVRGQGVELAALQATRHDREMRATRSSRQYQRLRSSRASATK